MGVLHVSGCTLNSEEKFRGKLRHARISRLSCAERPKRRVTVQFIERADLVRAIHGSGANAFRCEVRMIQHFEVFRAEL
jgi:hypothetical protein